MSLNIESYRKIQNPFDIRACAVCLDDFCLDNTIYQIACKHFFCYECFFEHSKFALEEGRPAKCPICKIIWFSDLNSYNEAINAKIAANGALIAALKAQEARIQLFIRSIAAIVVIWLILYKVLSTSK